MPYLTFAKPLPDPSALEKTETGERPRSQVGNQTDNRAEFTQRSEVCKQLREAYDGAPVHQSRTLDQYYYSSLPNTSARDNDQVVSRYLQKEGKKENIRILRVDQLWLWVIDESMQTDIPFTFLLLLTDLAFSEQKLLLPAQHTGLMTRMTLSMEA
jgi:hypothetical protein